MMDRPDGVPADRDPDEPLTLAEACDIFFRNKIKPSTLRKMALDGHLVIERIGRRHFVTPAGIKEMRRKCQVGVPQKDLDSGLSPSESTRTDGPSRPHGAFGMTDDPSVALASLLRSAERLNKRYSNTSPKSGASSQAH